MATEFVDWSDISENSGKQGASGVNRLTLEAGKSYRVRPIHKLVPVWRYWNKHNGQNRTAICDDPENCNVAKKYNLEPSERYALHVIDREDGKIKVLEAPVSVIQGFKAWATATGKNPSGSTEGGDFSIQVNNKQGMQRRYKVVFLEQKPLTDEEKAQAKQEMVNLKELYKPHSEEDIERILFSDDPFGKKDEEEDDFASGSGSPAQSSDDSFDNDDIPF